jgi:peptide/nickel transport system substrate-binding protein
MHRRRFSDATSATPVQRRRESETGPNRTGNAKMRRILMIACLAAALCHTAAAQTLRIALREDPDILDPTLARTYVGRIVFAGLCDKLFDIDEKLAIVPMLATGYEWADPKTMIIHLRTGVTFQDGTTMDAASVKYSLERHLKMQGSFRRSEIGMIDHVDVVDPQTVRVVLKSPSAPFLAQLTDRAGMIVSPKAAEAEGKDFGSHPVCTGPFKFAERVANDHITLDRYPGYWNAASIHFDHVIYQSITETAVRLANLQAGATDLVEQIVPTDVDAVRRDPKLRIVTSDSLGYQGITVNLANGAAAKGPMGTSALVRRAFDLAIDRNALVQVVYTGLYQPTVQGISASSPFHAKLAVPARDVAKAHALLVQAGVTLPVKVTMNVPNTPDIRQAAEVIQSMVNEAGFDLQLNTMEFAASLAAEARGDYQTYLIAWSGRSDPDGNLYSVLHTGAGQNTGHYSNPVVDAALDGARAVTAVDARAALYAKLFAQERQDLPIIYLWTPENIVGMSAKITGFRAVPDGIIRLQGLAFAP